MDRRMDGKADRTDRADRADRPLTIAPTLTSLLTSSLHF